MIEISRKECSHPETLSLSLSLFPAHAVTSFTLRNHDGRQALRSLSKGGFRRRARTREMSLLSRSPGAHSATRTNRAWTWSIVAPEGVSNPPGRPIGHLWIVTASSGPVPSARRLHLSRFTAVNIVRRSSNEWSTIAPRHFHSVTRCLDRRTLPERSFDRRSTASRRFDYEICPRMSERSVRRKVCVCVCVRVSVSSSFSHHLDSYHDYNNHTIVIITRNPIVTRNVYVRELRFTDRPGSRGSLDRR